MIKNKKGFTLVELVIVIAVIASLSAVLLPTFSSVIVNAKVSSATQQATNSLKDYFARVSTLNTEDSIDTMDNLKGYIIIVDNGKGAGDYMFIVEEKGRLSICTQIDHTRGKLYDATDNEVTQATKVAKIGAPTILLKDPENSTDEIKDIVYSENVARWRLIKLGQDKGKVGQIGHCYIYIPNVEEFENEDRTKTPAGLFVNDNLADGSAYYNVK